MEIYDTTLRDGTQREGLSLGCDDKLRIAKRLDEVGVTTIEGGWPGSNPKDEAFFQRARRVSFRRAQLAAFGSTRRADLTADQDPQVQALLNAETPVCTIFGKSWRLHVVDVLRTTLDENLRMIEDTVRHLKSRDRRVVYDAEHFFDGYRDDPEYALRTLRAAVAGGADVVVLCDTNGGNMPWSVHEVTSRVVELIGEHATVGIHAHNDTECAVANSLAAVQAGARHVQGTINGYGERCGNANLCSIIPNLQLKLGFTCLPKSRLRELFDLAHFVAETANLAPDEHMAYVGRSAFAHKGGVHVAALRRHVDSYQHIDPALIGNECRVVVSELSGRGNVLSKAEELGVVVSEECGREVLESIKDGEARGMAYEGAEASVALLLERQNQDYRPPFQLVDYQVTAGQRGGHFIEATIKLNVGNQAVHTVAEGNGPVSALDAALRKALQPIYPEVDRIALTDYKVRILDAGRGCDATTRVLITHRSVDGTYVTVGASTNIIEASLQAMLDGFEFGLAQIARATEEAS